MGFTFFNFFLCFSFWNNRCKNVLLVSIFENAWKKVINFQKPQKWHFVGLITFFGAFSKLPNKITFVCLLFLKPNQSQNRKEKFFLTVFIQKPKTRFFGGQNKIVFKLKFQICIFAFVLFCKRKLLANFHKKILIFEPPGMFWKWKLWCACAGARRPRERRYFGFGLLKSYMTFGYLTCSVRSKKIPHSTLLGIDTLVWMVSKTVN